MGIESNLIKSKINLLKFLIGGHVEIVNLFCESNGISWRYRASILKTFVKTQNLYIDDFNYFNQEKVESLVKELALAELPYSPDYESYFTSHSLPFAQGSIKSHYNSDYNIMAKLMIEYSLFEEDEKADLLERIRHFKYNCDVKSFITDYFSEDSYSFITSSFISETINHEYDIEIRLMQLSDILKKINISLIKNNETLSSRSLSYKKEIAKIINNALSVIKNEINLKLEFYVKSIQTNDYLGHFNEMEPREFYIGKLIETKNQFSMFNKLEKKLISINLLSNEYNKWQGSAKAFIEFYQLCENADIFKSIHKDNSKGVKLLRKMYNFSEGESIDKCSKRKKYNSSSKITYHSFLHNII